VTSGAASRVVALAAGRPATAPAPDLAGAAHPARRLLHALLDGEPGDDDAAVAGLREEYARQAPAWQGWTSAQADYLAPLVDALERNPDLAAKGTVVVDLGTGTGEALPPLLARGSTVVAIDLVREMVREVPPGPRCLRVQADVRRLPLASASVDLVVGLNAVPCWDEMSRVLRLGGRVLWVSSFGPRTPLYVPPDRLAASLPGSTVEWAPAGHGHWALVEVESCRD
jgi:SAM-dependent methyltransferase